MKTVDLRLYECSQYEHTLHNLYTTSSISKTTGTNVDPYNPIRGEKYLIKKSRLLKKVLQGFSG